LPQSSVATAVGSYKSYPTKLVLKKKKGKHLYFFALQKNNQMK